MATISGTVTSSGLTKMTEGVTGQATLYLVATDATQQETYSSVVSYGSAVNGVADITANVTLTIPSGGHIDSVKLSTSSTGVGTGDATVLTDIDFDNGGDLIIESFKITVSAV